MYIWEYVVYDIFQLIEYLHARYRKKRLLFSFSFFHCSYTSTTFRTSLFFSAYSARHSPDSIEWSSLSFSFRPPVNYLQFSFDRFSRPNPCFPLAFLAVTRPFSLLRFAPRARDVDAVCRTRAFAFSLRVTEHSIEPGSKRTLRSAELTRIPFPLFRPLPSISINQSILR